MLKELFGKKKISKSSVLIVEDDAMLARVLAESLKLEKIKVSIVSNGADVLEQVDKIKPKIILLDLILPGIDGFTVLKQLKDNPGTASIPVVVVSNLDQASDVKSVKALGADQYFLKSNTDIKIIIEYVKNKLKK